MSSSKNRKSKRQIRLEKNKNVLKDLSKDFYTLQVNMTKQQSDILDEAFKKSLKDKPTRIKNE